MPRRLSLLAGLLLAALLAAACGTTVRVPDRDPAGAGLAPQQGVTTTSPGELGATAGLGGLDTTGATQGAAASGVPNVGEAFVAQSAGAGTSAADRDPIEIGFITTAMGNATSLGFNAGQSYPDRSTFDALVSEYNAHGGVAGHRMVPVYGATDTASNDWSTQFAAVCATFTQDHHVKAVIGYLFMYLPSFESCLAKASLPHLYAGYQPGDAVDQQQIPTLIGTGHPTVDGTLLTALEGAQRSRLLTTSTKLGVMVDDCADVDRAYQRTAEPWLKRHHIDYRTVVLECTQGAGDISSMAAAVSNAELPANQMRHYHGFGWMPSVDVDPRHQPYPQTAKEQACIAKLAKHGLQPSEYNDFMTAYAACDGIELYAEALANGSTQARVVTSSAVAAIPAFVGALTYGGSQQAASHQRGGPARYREYGWTEACPCLTYRGGLFAVPNP